MRRDSRIAGEAPCPRKSKPGIAIHLALGRSTETPGGSTGGMRRQLDPNGVMRHRVRNQMLVAHAAPGGRGGEIRTRDLLNPIQVRYQAAPHPGGRSLAAAPAWGWLG